MPAGIYIRTEEHRKHLSESHKDKKRKPLSGETKLKISEKLKGNKNSLGYKCSPEQIEKIRLNRIGKKLSEEHRKKLRESHIGKKLSEKHKQNISKALKGKLKKVSHIAWNKEKKGIYSPETLEKIKVSHRGKKQSKETRRKISLANIGKMSSPKCGYGKGCYYDSPLQGKVWLRSTWELAYAKFLDKNEILWKHEDKRFNLGDTTYTPDFFLPNEDKYIEVKGYMFPKAQEKINKTLELYDIDLEILFKEDLEKLGVIL